MINSEPKEIVFSDISLDYIDEDIEPAIPIKENLVKCKHSRCMCACHRNRGIMHCMPCCYNCSKCGAKNVK